jgi:hypothetical protein
MSTFNLEKALAETTRILANRVKTRSTAYVLYYSNQNNRYDGKITGFTIKQLITEFRALPGAYKYAFITKINDDRVVRFYNSAVGKKFMSTVEKVRRKKAV